MNNSFLTALHQDSLKCTYAKSECRFRSCKLLTWFLIEPSGSCMGENNFWFMYLKKFQLWCSFLHVKVFLNLSVCDLWNSCKTVNEALGRTLLRDSRYGKLSQFDHSRATWAFIIYSNFPVSLSSYVKQGL